MGDVLNMEMEKFRACISNRNEYFKGLHPELKPEFAITNYWKFGASFHLSAGHKALVCQLQPPHVGVLDDWMMTISILSCRLTGDGRIMGDFPVIDQSQRFSQSTRDNIQGWVDYASGDYFIDSTSLSNRWDEKFMEQLFPKREA